MRGVVADDTAPTVKGAPFFVPNGNTPVPGILNGLDKDNDALSFGVVSPPSGGVVASSPDGGFVAGTVEGTVVWLDAAGKIERQVKILTDLASPDPRTMLRALREAKLVEPGQVEPHAVPAAPHGGMR